MSLKRVPYARAPRTEARAGLEARLLVEYWRGMAVLEVVTYAAMQELTGQDLQRRSDLLRTACHIMETQYQMLFRPVPGVGYIRLDDPGKVQYVEEKTSSIHRRAARNLQRHTTIDLGRLSATDQLRAMSDQTVNAAVHLYTHEQTRQALAEARTPPALTPFDRDAHAKLTGLWGPG